MRRAARLVAGALATAVAVTLGLTGCVGIPTSGGVETGPVIDEQLDPDFVIDPAGPRAGSTQEEILADFMLALRGPQNNYEVARQFLSAEISTQWNPDASATIRTGIPATTLGEAENTLEYTITTRAFVDADGRYFEPGTASQTLVYGFTQQDGEWRISSAPDGIVLSQSSFTIVFAESALYFFDPSFTFLVPDVRWFPSRATVTVRIAGALLNGPAAWLQQGVVLTAFPISTSLSTASIESGVATVELSPEALAASPTDRDRMRQQLAATLDVADVIMTVGGIELTTPPTVTLAVKDPTVEAAPLVGRDGAFGFDTGEGISALGALSEAVVSAGAVAATLSNDDQTVAFLSDAGVSVAQRDEQEAVLVDGRSGLVAPSIDPFRFVWSSQSASAATLSTFELDGTEHAVTTGLPADASVVSVDVSRDGARILLYLSTPLGPRLAVAGIIRDQQTVPTALGSIEYLPVVGSTPVDATWVDNRTVATLSRSAEVSPITLYGVGGPTTALGQVPDGSTIVGGNGGSDGIRVLGSTGDILRPQGSSWVSTGVSATFLATKQ